MLVYDGDQHRYAQIAGHGFRILAEAMEKDLPYEIKCPSLLICGTKDHAGSCIRYNREWHRKTKIKLMMVERFIYRHLKSRSSCLKNREIVKLKKKEMHSS